ncbi:hypothetical protein RTP6_001429 [Batrachochytrium dendrobatidis]
MEIRDRPSFDAIANGGDKSKACLLACPVRNAALLESNNDHADPLSSIPKELALSILAYLDLKSLCSSYRTCQRWRVLCSDNLLWYKIAVQSGFWTDSSFPAFVSKSQSLSTDVDLKAEFALSGQLLDTSICWKTRLKHQYAAERNWMNSNCKVMDFSGHTDVVLSVKLYRENIISGSRDGLIIVFNTVTGKCKHMVRGHDAGISCLDRIGSVVYSGSWDNQLKVWHVDETTGKLEIRHTLMHHGSIICLKARHNHLVSGTWGGRVYLWNTLTRMLEYILSCPNQVELVSCVDFNTAHIFSGIAGSITIWCRITRQAVRQFTGHSSSITSLSLKGGMLFTASEDKTAVTWDISGLTPSNVDKHPIPICNSLVGHFDGVRCLASRANLLITGSYDSTIRVWCIKRGICLYSLSGHAGDINTLDCDESRIVSGSDDMMVKVWDFQSWI